MIMLTKLEALNAHIVPECIETVFKHVDGCCITQLTEEVNSNFVLSLAEEFVLTHRELLETWSRKLWPSLQCTALQLSR